MSLLKGAAALALVLSLATAGIAVPNLVGSTGLLLTPTTQTLATGDYNVAVFMVENGPRAIFAAHFGLRDDVEAGFATLLDKKTVINAKYAFLPEQAKQPALSVGVIDLTDQGHPVLYLVASKGITTGKITLVQHVQFNLGLASGGEKAGAEVPLDGLFGSLSFNVGKSVRLIVEHDTDHVNSGVQATVLPGLVGTVGVVGHDQDLVGGLSYTRKF